MRPFTDSPSSLQTEWTELDEIAAREGAAALRLRRRTGAESPNAGELHCAALARCGDGRRDYDRAAAIAAFARLFQGEPSRTKIVGDAAERQRRCRAARKRLSVGASVGASVGESVTIAA